MKHLLGEATAAEEEQVKEWVNEDAANLAYYNGLKKVWETSRQLAAESDLDEEQAWQRFQTRIQQPAQKAQVKTMRRFSWIRVAASLLFAVALGVSGYWVVNNRTAVKDRLVETRAAVLSDTLPDGSVVTLNKQSSISYPSKFKGDKRAVTLKGEAFFNVTPNKKKPFVITVNDVEVTVLGTSFNIKSENGNTEVIVETGVVSVKKGGKTVELHAREQTMVTAVDTGFAKKGVEDRLYNYYRSKEFVCDNTPLWKLVELLNQAYSTQIVFGREELKQLQMTSTFNNESLDQVLNVVSLTFGIKVIREGDKIILQ